MVQLFWLWQQTIDLEVASSKPVDILGTQDR